jgi:hypothetical protein
MLHFMLAFALLGSPQSPDAAPPAVTPAEWRSDLHRLVHIIDSVHPWPWRRISADAFHDAARQLALDIPRLRADQVVGRMMQLVAMLRDGHTTLYPAGRAGFDRWFPIRLYRFADSLAVTAVDSANASLAGARVLRIGGIDASAAAARIASFSGADNLAGARQLTGLLSSAPATRAAGLSDGETLALQVRTVAGETRDVVLHARVTEWGDPAWMQRGEMFGPPGVAVVTAFNRRTPLDYRKMSLDLPLQLRNRIPIWFTWLPEDSTLYVQSNFTQDFNGTSFAAVVDSLFVAADARPVRRFVLDLRYNSGGDGSKVLQFVHEVIRRRVLDQPGRFVVLTSGKTFSAAVLWLSQLREHTSAVIVGEAAGAARNHSGDAGTFTLPASGMQLQVSTLRHYGTRSDDTSSAELPGFPVAMTAGDYFRGDDPALAFARSHGDLRTVPAIAAADGAASALAELARRQARYGRISGWQAFDEREMNLAGYDLLRHGRLLDAITIFRANTEAYPTAANVWDSYGEVLLSHGDTAAAVASYRRAVELDPGNDNARAIVKRLGGH